MNYYTYKIILLFIALLSYVSVFAQPVSIQGVVKDSASGKSLPYVSIQAQNSNKGTISNDEGKFNLIVDSASASIKISFIGYDSKTIRADVGQKDLEILLHPRSYETNTVEVEPYTWAERFILKAIKAKDEAYSKLEFYKAEAYSKTLFIKQPSQLGGLIEAVSDVYYQRPDQYLEKVIASKIPPHIKNLPLSAIAINQMINLNNEYARIENFYLVSPLNEKALKYYDFSLLRRDLYDNDTLVVLGVEPRANSTPLFAGELWFNEKTFQLVEANLKGNSASKNAVIDSVSLFQKYSFRDSVFNLPVFSKFSVGLNCFGLKMTYQQEYTFINYRINDPNFKPVISAGRSFVEEKQISYDLEKSRNYLFKVPLTLSEQKHNELIDSVFNRASFLRRILFFSLIEAPPLILDEPASLAGLNITRFSNWYHFNKAEGHYLGFEFQPFREFNSSLYLSAGYGFTSRLLSFNLLFNWGNFNMKIGRSMSNLGNFQFNRSIQSLDALISHKDDNNYFLCSLLKLNYHFTTGSKLDILPYLKFEKQQPVEYITDFSLFNSGRKYPGNFPILPYNNNSAGIEISYLENPEIISGDAAAIKGRSFTNLKLAFETGSRAALSSTENNFSFKIDFHRYQEIYAAINMNLMVYFQKQNKSHYIQKMNFVNQGQTDQNPGNQLSFFSLSNYEFYLHDFLHIKTDFALLELPEIYTFRIKLGGTVAFLRPLDEIILKGFTPLRENFYEYGIAIKGLSFLNLYIIKNNQNPKEIFLQTTFGF